MAEITREKIEENLIRMETYGGYIPASFATHALRLALKALDQDADARLGAAVRDCFNGVTPKKAARIAITIASECEDGSFSEMVFSAIAKSLREEGER